MATQTSMYDLFSALQKSIRRGDERKALDVSFALDAENDKLWTKSRAGSMWSILRRITAEDISLANPSAGYVVERNFRFWTKQIESLGRAKHCPWRLFTVETVLLLCRSPKNRIVDHACIAIDPVRLTSIVEEWRQNPQPLVLPDYTHDGLHTGKKNGKTVAEFIIRENDALNPKADIDDPYLRQIKDAINKAC